MSEAGGLASFLPNVFQVLWLPRRGRVRTPLWPLLVLGTLLPVLAPAQAGAQQQTERTQWVTNPAGTHAIAVEWDAPVGWGEAVEFQGTMVVQVADVRSSSTRQRQIEAPQVRTVHSPIWIDSQWAAFSYNVQKNFNGLVYVNAADGTALQVEMIAPVRRMGQTGRSEADLTSLDITVHTTTETVRYRNITRGRASIFPLVLEPLQLYAGIPYPRAFLLELQKAIAAYAQWLRQNGVASLRLELGSESFSPDENHLGLLACLVKSGDGESTAVPALVLVPCNKGAAVESLQTAQLVLLDSEIELACSTHGTDQLEPAPDPLPATLIRYTTRWQDAQTVAVEREVTDEDREQLQAEPIFLVDLQGKTSRLPAADKTPVPPPPREPAQEEAADSEQEADPGQTQKNKKESSAIPKPSPTTRPTPQSSPARQENRRSAKTPAASPSPRADRRIPAVTAPSTAPSGPPTPTPYTAEPIPRLLNRLNPMRGGEQSTPPASPTPQGGEPGTPRP